MQISPINMTNKLNVRKAPAFSGIKLGNAYLQRILPDNSTEMLPVYFTKLTEDDCHFLRNVSDSWLDTDYGNYIICNFIKSFKDGVNCRLKDKMTFMIENPSTYHPDERIKALAEVTVMNNSMNIDFIQSASCIGGLDKVRGAGAYMMYALSKFAEKLKIKDISLYSGNVRTDRWYSSLGFKEEVDYNCRPIPIYVLTSDKFKAFQKNINKKYKLNPHEVS